MTRCFITKKSLFEKKKGLQCRACKHGKPRHILASTPRWEYLQTRKRRKGKRMLEPSSFPLNMESFHRVLVIAQSTRMSISPDGGCFKFQFVFSRVLTSQRNLLKQGGNGAGEPRWAGQDLLTKPSMARYQETTHILGQSEIPRGLRLGGGCGARGSWEGAGTQVSRHPCFSISMGGAA